MLQTEKMIRVRAKVATRIHNLYYITNIVNICNIKLATTCICEKKNCEFFYIIIQLEKFSPQIS